MAGNSTVHIGTWEGHVAPKEAPDKVKRQGVTWQEYGEHLEENKFLQVRIVDPSFLLLIQRFLKAGYMDSDVLFATEQGTPQGGNLSPTLSNIFLHYVLDLWFEKRLRRETRRACFRKRRANREY